MSGFVPSRLDWKRTYTDENINAKKHPIATHCSSGPLPQRSIVHPGLAPFIGLKSGMNNGTIATARTRNVVRTPNQAESFVTELVSEPNSHAVPQARKIIAGASHNPGCPNSGLKASSQINANTDPIKIAAESSLCESNPKPPIARNKKHVRDQRASSGQQSTSEKHKPQTIQAKDSLQDLGHFWNFWRFLRVLVGIVGNRILSSKFIGTFLGRSP